MATIVQRHGYPCLNHIDGEHTPYNMLAWEAREREAVSNTEITYYDGSKSRPEPWLRLKLEELTTNKKGVVTSRVISVHLHGDDVAKLRELLTMSPTS